MGSGFYGINIPEGNNYAIYNVMSPIDNNNEVMQFGSEDHFRNIVWHEFSHSFINHLTDQYIEKVKIYEPLLFNPIKSAMAAQAYSNWTSVVNEHIIRAITIRLTAKRYGDKDAKSLFQSEVIGKSFIYIEPICEQLNIYESNRSKYKVFDDFFPLLLNAFEKARVKDYTADFLGNLNFSSGRVDFIIISTGEKNEELQKNLNKFVEDFRNMFFYNTPIITDKEALTWDLSDKRNLIVFGTIE
ncbi:MAG: DUF4932 domain-containing protein, partial [Bacteroidales bacterium]|nr:DUF4932 domain-containing protein [Bacteroidales bacterium]